MRRAWLYAAAIAVGWVISVGALALINATRGFDPAIWVVAIVLTAGYAVPFCTVVALKEEFDE